MTVPLAGGLAEGVVVGDEVGALDGPPVVLDFVGGVAPVTLGTTAGVTVGGDGPMAGGDVFGVVVGALTGAVAGVDTIAGAVVGVLVGAWAGAVAGLPLVLAEDPGTFETMAGMMTGEPEGA